MFVCIENMNHIMNKNAMMSFISWLFSPLPNDVLKIGLTPTFSAGMENQYSLTYVDLYIRKINCLLELIIIQ
jgi:hypothetical protein